MVNLRQSGFDCNIGGKLAWMSSLAFRVEFDSVRLLKAKCLQEQCCNKLIMDKFKQSSSSKYYEGVQLGKQLEGVQFNCKDNGHKINKTTAKCIRSDLSGAGWDLLGLKDNEVCVPCPAGTYYNPTTNSCPKCPLNTYSNKSASRECAACPVTSYTTKVGSTQCDCKRGLIRSNSTEECEYCPAGHTTYRGYPGLCIGPYLEGSGSNQKHLATFPLSLTSLGSLNNKIVRWKSLGDWYLLKNHGNSGGIIRQRYTTSHRSVKNGKSIRKRKNIISVTAIIKNVFCYTETGVIYRGYANRTFSGKDCTGPENSCTTANGAGVCYCRNHAQHDKPVCETESGEIEHCDVPKCRDEIIGSSCRYSKSGVSNTPLSETGIYKEVLGLDLDQAKNVCDKMGKDCKGVWEETFGNWRLTNIGTESLQTGKTRFEKKEKGCVQPYYEHYFDQSYDI